MDTFPFIGSAFGSKVHSCRVRLKRNLCRYMMTWSKHRRTTHKHLWALGQPIIHMVIYLMKMATQLILMGSAIMIMTVAPATPNNHILLQECTPCQKWQGGFFISFPYYIPSYPPLPCSFPSLNKSKIWS